MTRKEKCVVLWSIHDHIATLSPEAGSNAKQGSKVVSDEKATTSPSIGPRGVYQGHVDTIEDEQFCHQGVLILMHMLHLLGQQRLTQNLFHLVRGKRFEAVTKNLKVTRVCSTLVKEMKIIQSTNTKVLIAQSERSPVLLLMRGGMGAGKSTVLKDILKE
ncbi:hypothetical protein RJT34_16134 [Clitoria ternatea]|uniref:Uncharacterized protein n=1 Tax=Clitoria ternatea TaxID=43366 RepID=A0AAN9PCM2_CLITE